MRRRARLLPLGAIVAVAVVLAVQLLSGGSDYKPAGALNPCGERRTGPLMSGIEALAERIVLTGTDEAACRLGVSRERLLLGLATPADRARLAQETGRTQPQLTAALKNGLSRAVTRLDRKHQLPPVSSMRGEITDQLGLPSPARALVDAIPDSTVDDLLPTAGVLQRSIAKIDGQKLLDNLQDPDALQPQLRDAIEKGAIDEARARLVKKLPGPLGSLF